MSDFWNREEDVSEYEMLDEQETPAPAPIYEAEDIDDEELESIVEEAAFELDVQEQSTIYNARLRLEQARLYEMLINHNMFDGVDASERAIKNVQTELKEYIVNRLEILLGIKQEKKVVVEQESISISSQFNDVEIDFMKQLAYKGTKGASSEGKEVIQEVRKETGLKPLVSKPASKLKPMKKTKPAPPKRVIVPEQMEEPLQQAPKKKPKKKAAPKKRAVNPNARPRDLNQTEIERIAQEQIDKEQEIMDGVGNWKKLSTEEKARRIAEVNGVKNKPVNKGEPMPSPDQLQMKYQMQEQNRAARGGGGNSMNLIASAIAARKQQEG